MTPGWINRLVSKTQFQAFAARFPLTRRLVRREGEALFDIVAGFCHSQILAALVGFDIPDRLLYDPQTADQLARRTGVPLPRMEVLLNGGVAIGLLKRRGQSYRLTRRGAALVGVPGLQGMIAHHHVLYRDLADPVAFFRGETQTELAAFWPYVFGASGVTDPAVAVTYSALMADSQTLVAQDTLDVVSLAKVRHLVDVGGGTGAFLTAVAARYAAPRLSLFDLPAVVPGATARFANAGITDRVQIVPGSFRDGPLPQGADAISLIRVLYDHSDATVIGLLQAVHAALPVGGRLIVSEPMTGGDTPQRAGDAYFALYCMAMRTGRARSADQIATLLRAVGFTTVRRPRSRRAFITTVVESVR